MLLDRRSFLALIWVAVLLAGAASSAEITSWTNSKTKNKKRMFLVKAGEKITFKVMAQGAEKYTWLVDGKVQKKGKEDSFTWRAPRKDGIWRVSVRAVNRKVESLLEEMLGEAKELYEKNKKAVLPNTRPGQMPYENWKTRTGKWEEGVLGPYYPWQCQHEWILSTSYRNVKPNGSIQKALNSIPATGGIVELGPGKYTLSSPLWIRKGNLALLGAGMDKTVLVGADVNINSGKEIKNVRTNPEPHWGRGGSILGKRYDKYHWRRAKETSWVFTYPRARLDFDARGVLRNIMVGHLSIQGGGLGACEVADLMVTDLKASKSIHVYASVHTVVKHCSSGGVAFLPDIACAVVDCNVVGGNIHMNGEWYSPYTELPEYPPSLIARNRVKDGGGIFIYSASSGLIRDNICERAKQYNIGVRCSSRCLFSRNIMREGRKEGLYLDNASSGNIFRNNLIYSNSRHGVFLNERRSPSRNNKLINNTIYGNRGDGIYNKGTYAPVALNNIVAGNEGVGIRGKFTTISHNDLWNNRKGNYADGAKRGAGDISANPLFADPTKDDFHLKSGAGRWNLRFKKWVRDAASSPCIDAGNPAAAFSKEPSPNSGRINMGTYGNTKEASKSGSKISVLNRR